MGGTATYFQSRVLPYFLQILSIELFAKTDIQNGKDAKRA